MYLILSHTLRTSYRVLSSTIRCSVRSSDLSTECEQIPAQLAPRMCKSLCHARNMC